MSPGGGPSLVLRDQEGGARAVLEAAPDGETALALYADGAKLGLLLVIDRTSAAVTLWREGEKRAALASDPEAAMLVLYDQKAQRRAALVVSADENPRLILFDKNGQPLAWGPP
jgi:hypothetical protein